MVGRSMSFTPDPKDGEGFRSDLKGISKRHEPSVHNPRAYSEWKIRRTCERPNERPVNPSNYFNNSHRMNHVGENSPFSLGFPGRSALYRETAYVIQWIVKIQVGADSEAVFVETAFRRAKCARLLIRSRQLETRGV